MKKIKKDAPVLNRLKTGNKNKFFIIYLKGFLMGICDLIPGISGGTIAFITGIYERLIIGIKQIGTKEFFLMKLYFIKGDFKNFKKLFKKLDMLFLIILFLGIFSAIFSGAGFISYLLENYFVFLLTFFVGLILASSLIIFKEIKIHSQKNYLIGFFGFLIGLIFLFISPIKVLNPSFLYILFGGFMAVFALFLPGISGSFILLILGLYEFIINSVKNIGTKSQNLIPFAIGAILSIFIVSRLIDFLFKKDKCKTLYFLFGLVLGTLLIPIFRINLAIQTYNLSITLKLLVLFLIGFYIVFLFNKIE